MYINSTGQCSVSSREYEYYPDSCEQCVDSQQSITISVNNQSDETKNESIQKSLSSVDQVNRPTGDNNVNQEVLTLATDIKQKTDKLKADYYEDAKKGSGKESPTIGDYIEAAKKATETDKKVDGDVIAANSTDCSGFVRMLYKEKKRPLDDVMKKGEQRLKERYKDNKEEIAKRYRGAELIRLGTKSVSKEDVRPGDLVFFKDIESSNKNNSGTKLTDYATHIGIVSKIEKDSDGKTRIYFTHKSTNGGVVESSLDSKARVNQNVRYRDLDPTFGRVE